MMKMHMAALTAAFLLVSGCSKPAPEPQAPEPKVEGDNITFPVADKAPKLAVKVVGYEPAPNVKLNGRIVWDEERTVRVYSPLAGRVNRILDRVGAARARDSPRRPRALRREAERAQRDCRNVAAGTPLEGGRSRPLG